jgi:GGDEF domain-containing protein
VVFQGKGVQEAVPHLEALREAIEGYQMYLRDSDRPKDDGKGKVRRSGKRPERTVSVTVSIGVAESGSRFPTPEDVIKAADVALYKAKGKGRNMVCTAGPGR